MRAQVLRAGRQRACATKAFLVHGSQQSQEDCHASPTQVSQRPAVTTDTRLLLCPARRWSLEWRRCQCARPTCPPAEPPVATRGQRAHGTAAFSSQVLRAWPEGEVACAGRVGLSTLNWRMAPICRAQRPRTKGLSLCSSEPSSQSWLKGKVDLMIERASSIACTPSEQSVLELKRAEHHALAARLP